MSKVPVLIGRKAQGRSKNPKEWEVVKLPDGRPAMGEGLRAEIRARRQEIVAVGGDGYEEVRYYETVENTYRFDPNAEKSAKKVAEENAKREAEAKAAAEAAEREAAAAALKEAVARAEAAGVTHEELGDAPADEASETGEASGKAEDEAGEEE